MAEPAAAQFHTLLTAHRFGGFDCACSRCKRCLRARVATLPRGGALRFVPCFHARTVTEGMAGVPAPLAALLDERRRTGAAFSTWSGCCWGWSSRLCMQMHTRVALNQVPDTVGVSVPCAGSCTPLQSAQAAQ